MAPFLICTWGISQSSWLDYSWTHWAMNIVENVKTQNTGPRMPQTPRNHFLSKLSNWGLSKMTFADNEEDLRQPCISDPWSCVYWEVSFKFETRTATSLFDDDFTCFEHILSYYTITNIWGLMRYVWLCITEVTSSIYLWRPSKEPQSPTTKQINSQ